MPHGLELYDEMRAGVCTIRIRGYLDANTSDELDGMILSYFRQGCYKLIFDLEGVDFLSSSGAGVLMAAYKNAESKQQVLFIDEQVDYRTVLLEFLAYSRAKLEQSPRLPKWLARAAHGFLGWIIKRISRKQAIVLESE